MLNECEGNQDEATVMAPAQNAFPSYSCNSHEVVKFEAEKREPRHTFYYRIRAVLTYGKRKIIANRKSLDVGCDLVEVLRKPLFL